MNDFFLIFTILIIPIFILLFVRNLKRKKIFYTFTFLDRYKNQSLKQIFLKIIHLFYDIIFDILIATVLALIFSNILIDIGYSQKVAFILDGSYSMMKTDLNGVSTFEKAVSYYYNQKSKYKSYDLYAAVFDIDSCSSRIVKINEMKRIINPKIFISDFLTRFKPFDFDEELLLSKKFNKYKKIIFITDLFFYTISNSQKSKFEIIELGKVEKDFIYPVSILYEPVSNDIICILLKSKGNFLPKVEVYDKNKLFISADDKIKIDYYDENSIFISTKERGLLKVSLFNQFYYINLSNIPLNFKFEGEYPTILKSVIFDESFLDEEIKKFGERGFIINKNNLPILIFNQGNTDKKIIKKLSKINKNEKMIVNIEFRNGSPDLIYDIGLTGGYVIGSDIKGLQDFLKSKKEIIKYYNFYDFNNFKMLFIYPVIMNKDFIYKPQSIVYFYLLSKYFKQNYINRYIIDEMKNNNSNSRLNILEVNPTSIMYKKKDKLFIKNISSKEIIQYKTTTEFDFTKVKDNNIYFYIILLAFLYIIKLLAFIFLRKNN